ncbi:MAG: lytic transglycosylase domain-containing protein [Acetobacter sp.]|nr:lytic transglycosylase domain-containing protein [Acetobacter sp.]
MQQIKFLYHIIQKVQPYILVSLLSIFTTCNHTAYNKTISLTTKKSDNSSTLINPYQPPGPPEDPWGPYIQEASRMFDVPEQWIRAVIQQESEGQLFQNGKLIMSHNNAMGLMQIMPTTYDKMRIAYNLGNDAYNPHDNIIAGTAYIRQLYDLYGSPGFLAAYNAGPKRLEDFITHNRALPRETRHYITAIGLRVTSVSPVNRSLADITISSYNIHPQHRHTKSP